MPDQNLEIRGRSSRPLDKWGGAVSGKLFFRPFGPQFGLKKWGGGGGIRAGPMGPSPGSATEVVKGYKKNTINK